MECDDLRNELIKKSSLIRCLKNIFFFKDRYGPNEWWNQCKIQKKKTMIKMSKKDTKTQKKKKKNIRS